MNRAVFLDRDGTLLEDIDYNCKFREQEVFPFSIEALLILRRAGFLLVVTTNQSAVARGICTMEEVKLFHREMQNYLSARKAHLDAFYFSPFHVAGIIPEFSRHDPSRKPAPGMLLQAAVDLEIDLDASFMVGDQAGDILAGKAAGCKTILVLTGKGRETVSALDNLGDKPDFKAENLLQAARLIEANCDKSRRPKKLG